MTARTEASWREFTDAARACADALDPSEEMLILWIRCDPEAEGWKGRASLESPVPPGDRPFGHAASGHRAAAVALALENAAAAAARLSAAVLPPAAATAAGLSLRLHLDLFGNERPTALGLRAARDPLTSSGRPRCFQTAFHPSAEPPPFLAGLTRIDPADPRQVSAYAQAVLASASRPEAFADLLEKWLDRTAGRGNEP